MKSEFVAFWLCVLGLLLDVPFVVAGMVYCYGQPYTWDLGKFIPWPYWTCFGLGTACWLTGQVLEWRSRFPSKPRRGSQQAQTTAKTRNPDRPSDGLLEPPMT